MRANWIGNAPIGRRGHFEGASVDRELLTDALDVLGLLLVAAGVTAAGYEFIGWAALGAGGVVVLAGSWVASRLTRPRQRKG